MGRESTNKAGGAGLPPMQGLPGARYTDPQIYLLERDQVLMSSWQLVCHISDLPGPGTAMRFDLMGRSAFVLRGSDGGIRAFLNVCRHRGSRLIDGDANTQLAYCVNGKIRCPYHAWVYDESGALVHLPREVNYPGVQRDALGLHALPLEVWLGFVFIAFRQPGVPVAELMGGCTAELEPYRLAEMRRISEPRLRPRRANWKVICENYLDSYHLAVAHPTLQQAVGSRYCFEDRGGVMHISGEIDSDNSRSWSARAYARWLPEMGELPPRRRRLWSYYFVWPNLALDVYPDQVDFMQMLPISSGETVIREVAYALPDPRREMRLARYLNWRINRQVNREDQQLVERMQLGLAGGDYDRGPIAVDETGLRWFTARVLETQAQAGGGKALASRRRKAGMASENRRGRVSK